MTDATAQVRRLRGVTWQWRDEAPDEAKAAPGMGIIAQDVEAVWPHLIERTEEGHLQVEYDGLIPPLMTACGELLARVAEIEEGEAKLGGEEERPAVQSAREMAGIAGPKVSTELDPDRIEKVYPDLVYTDEEGNRAVAYHGLVGPLVEAVKELDARLSALEGRLGQ